MSILNQPFLTDGSHLNRGLFSDHYLNHSVPENPGWVLDGARELREDLRQMLAGLQPDQLNEAQLEEQWVQPILERLGHHYAVQVRIRYRDSGRRIPDYLLMASPEDARAITTQTYTPSEIAHALGVADAKAWGTRLDQASQEQRNPSHQIDEYLRFSELKWGILTDGRYWRLYERGSSKNNVYYAVDLVDLLNQQNAEPFLYFYLFFRREAFVQGGWLDHILEGSHEYAEKISDDLEDQVYDALQVIAQGFLDYRRNRLSPTPADLRLIYENSLIFLYRLLFVLYTESRGILPLLQNDEYRRQYSLLAIKQRVAELAEFERRLSRDSGELYVRLNDLFYIIDVGNPDFAMPAYNGHLFSEETHRFLDEKKIGDVAFVRAVNLLTQPQTGPRRQGGDFVFIDYRDLTERHLGAIYEKLLDYELAVAEVPLVEKGNKWVPAREGETPDVPAGKVYLRTGSNERKITGSYYTPDYIVRFIVERTLEPLLTRITEQYATRDSEGNWEVQPDQAESLHTAILKINVLDPAIGSGHFLVDVVAYIAEWLRGLKLLPEDMASEEDELAYWKRQVVTACIYGVDVNPLAVELAKLSLWLATVAQGKPLSFLDHHIRVGNSLVGTRLSEMTLSLSGGDSLMGEFDTHIGGAVRAIRRIEATIADHVSDVKQQEATYITAFADLAPWHRLANVWTAHRLGLPLSEIHWESLRNHALYQLPLSAEAAAILEQAQAMAESGFYFHWDLTFPEIFFDEDGKPLIEAGFDAVIGNPPYVRQERLTPIKGYLERHYEIYQGTADLFLYFYERGLKMLKRGEVLAFITSGTYMNSNSAGKFRGYIHKNAALVEAFNFGENQPFKGAEMVYPTILILRRDTPRETFRSYFMQHSYPYHRLEEPFWQTVTEAGMDALTEVTGMDEWRFQDVRLTRLFQKITAGKTTLQEAVNGAIYYGIKTGYNEAFVINADTRQRLIDEHPSSAEIIKPMLRGQDLRPWYQENSGLYLIFANGGIEIDRYPAIKKYLEQYRTRLEPKPPTWDDRKDGTWQGRAGGNYQWYELQATISYANVFEGAKILLPDIGKIPRYSWDDRGYYANDKGTAIVPSSGAILPLLNSRISWFALSQIATPLRLRGGLWQYQAKLQFVRRLPIPDLTAEQERELSELAQEITELARQRYALHESTRHRIQVDLGGGANLNTALTEWWSLPPESLRDQVQAAFGRGRDIPLRDRNEWEGYLREQQTEHGRLTDAIIAREIRLNEIVYAAFKLDAEEIALIEAATQYPYGAV